MLVALGVKAQNDPHSLRLMGIPLEGVIDSVIPRLKAAEWTPWGDADDGEDFFFRGKFYGIRAKLMVSVKPETKMVTSAYVTIGPYSTQQMLDMSSTATLDEGEAAISTDGLKAATIYVATLPILLVYPFIQKYFVKGIMVGGVKG